MSKIITSKTNRKTMILLELGVVLLILTSLFFILGGDPVSVARNELSTQQSSLSKTDSTVGNKWQWGGISDEKIKESIQTQKKQIEPDSEITPIDVVEIYHALQDVKLQENGNLVIDDEALQALYRTMEFEGIYFDNAGLEELSDVIKAGLPGVAGEQTADVVTNFYHYLVAKKEFETTREMPKTQEELRSYYESLVQLREQTLGYEVAQQLFQKEDAESRYMLESMLLAKTPELSDEERQATQESLRKQYLEPDPEITNWTSRLQSFRAEKQIIQEAGLEENERNKQLESLYRQHFSTDERAKIAELKLDRF